MADRARISMFPVSGALQLNTSDAQRQRPMRSATKLYSTFVNPRPQRAIFSSLLRSSNCRISSAMAGGIKRFQRPSFRAMSLRCCIGGKTCHLLGECTCASIWASSGKMCVSMKSVTFLTRSRARSPTEKLAKSNSDSNDTPDVGMEGVADTDFGVWMICRALSAINVTFLGDPSLDASTEEALP